MTSQAFRSEYIFNRGDVIRLERKCSFNYLRRFSVTGLNVTLVVDQGPTRIIVRRVEGAVGLNDGV